MIKKVSHLEVILGKDEYNQYVEHTVDNPQKPSIYFSKYLAEKSGFSNLNKKLIYATIICPLFRTIRCDINTNVHKYCKTTTAISISSRLKKYLKVLNLLKIRRPYGI